MSALTLNLLDRDRAVHGTPHGSMAETILAALSAEPETLAELAQALARFVKPEADRPFFAGWSRGTSDEPYDSGWCAVDLAARLVVCRSTYFAPAAEGEVRYRDGRETIDVPLGYHLADDWLLTDDVDGWRQLAKRRRAERAARPPLDFRAVLYGKVAPYLVEQCLAAHASGEAAPVSAIHARWLLTPRTDLCDLPPRDWLLARREFISWDLEDRAEQWSRLGRCPPGVERDTAAYRLGGCGTNEVVVYYDLVRHLLVECWERVQAEPDLNAEAEVARLEYLREEWLRTPQPDFDGRTPGQIIDNERRRIPEAVSGHDAMVDDDCPLCQMLAESDGPMFWHLDGCNMDPDFAFSFHRTREEWEAEQREWEEFHQRWEQEHPAGEPAQGAPEDTVWRSSYSDPDAGSEALLFGLGAHLAELRQDCREKPDADRWLSALERDWGNLLAAAKEEGGCLVGPVAQRLRETLEELAATHPDLAAKCQDLGDQLADVAAGETDLPF